MKSTLLPFLVAVALAAVAAIDAAAPAVASPPPSAVGLETTVQPYLATYCYRCHGEKKHKGDLRLDTLSRDFASGGSAPKWLEVMERISSGEMPPEDERQPSADESARIVEVAGGEAPRRRGGPAGQARAGDVSQADARRIRQHDLRSARRALRRDRPHRPARRPGMARLRADRLGALAVAVARGEVFRRGRNRARGSVPGEGAGQVRQAQGRDRPPRRIRTASR